MDKNNYIVEVEISPKQLQSINKVLGLAFSPKEIENWKTQLQLNTNTPTNNHNFVTLASQYREYLKNKTWKNILK